LPDLPLRAPGHFVAACYSDLMRPGSPVLVLVAAMAAPAVAEPDERAAIAAECERIGGAVVSAFGTDFTGDRARSSRGTAEQLGKLLCEVGRWPTDARACFRDAGSSAAAAACLERLPVVPRLELEAGMAGVNPSGVELTRTAVRMKGPVLFDDTDRIRPASDALLQALANVLVANPTVKIEIQGHVDDGEKPERAVKRSLRRAEAVRAFLVKHQVAAQRIAVRGLGAAQQIADRRTELGRARNRRIEIAVVAP
jgi:outer membrane protein OmpA-like peptidoglycan-associated protein